MKLTKDNREEFMSKKLVSCSNKGFHMKFKNGWIISVQFGIGNYCENYNNPVEEFREMGVAYASDDAEVWAWNGNEHYPKEPLGYQSPEQILKIINKLSKRKKK
ncbi:hypothetical protein LCGC14_2112510 [marine sediment metagenome]|uniref:Uncharacterized protein n=1 Tax=marine sediment metagenome TaxID=412755 RepID=A0A0F9H2X3_9ZZZZ